jgi:hypothetical protein
MNPSDLVAAISNSLTQIDNTLASGTPPFSSPQWQQLFALRKHLDDQQRTLIQSAIAADDATFQEAAGNVVTATASLTAAITQQARIDSIINVVAQIASTLDTVLKSI